MRPYGARQRTQTLKSIVVPLSLVAPTTAAWGVMVISGCTSEMKTYLPTVLASGNSPPAEMSCSPVPQAAVLDALEPLPSPAVVSSSEDVPLTRLVTVAMSIAPIELLTISLPLTALSAISGDPTPLVTMFAAPTASLAICGLPTAPAAIVGFG